MFTLAPSRSPSGARRHGVSVADLAMPERRGNRGSALAQHRKESPCGFDSALRSTGQRVQCAFGICGRAQVATAAWTVPDGLGKVGECQQDIVGGDVGQAERADPRGVDHLPRSRQPQCDRLRGGVPSPADVGDPSYGAVSFGDKAIHQR